MRFRHDFDAEPLHESLDLRFDSADIVQRRMGVSGEFYVFMQGAGVHDFKQISSAKGLHFLCGCISPVIAEDAANVASTQEKVGLLDQHDLCTGFFGANRSGNAGPSPTDYKYLTHGFSYSSILYSWKSSCSLHRRTV